MSVLRQSQVLLPSAARTATPKETVFDGQGDIVNLHLIIDVTAIAATPSVTVSVEALNPATGLYYPLLTATAITLVSTTVLRVGRDVVTAAGASVQDFIPGKFKIKYTHLDADSITYSVGMNYGIENNL